jgi:hypothetical protein
MQLLQHFRYRRTQRFQVTHNIPEGLTAYQPPLLQQNH